MDSFCQLKVKSLGDSFLDCLANLDGMPSPKFQKLSDNESIDSFPTIDSCQNCTSIKSISCDRKKKINVLLELLDVVQKENKILKSKLMVYEKSEEFYEASLSSISKNEQSGFLSKSPSREKGFFRTLVKNKRTAKSRNNLINQIVQKNITLF